MRILFINPCLRKGATVKLLPVGLASVMTYVSQYDYEFDLLDIDINEHSDSYVENYINNNKYDVILSGSIVTHYKWMKWMVSVIKKHHPSTKVVIGNSVGGSCQEVFLRNTPVDIIVYGEGEVTCYEVLESLKNNKGLEAVLGIAYRNKKGDVIKNPPRKACNVNELPYIDWEFFEVESYISKAGELSRGIDEGSEDIRTMPIPTARGCAFKCSFCHYVFWDDPYRMRSPENILGEISKRIEKYEINYFNFWDDLSFASLSQLKRLVDAILLSGLKFKWSAAVRTDLFGKDKWPYTDRLELAKRMVQAGCVSVGYSLESANKEILQAMNKHVLPEYFIEQITLLRKVGIDNITSVVFGYPDETPDTIKETFDMCLKAEVYPSIGFLLPLPSTGMYQYALDNGFIKDEDEYLSDITERQDICINMTKYTDQEILTAIEKNAQSLSDKLEIGLNKNNLIKTGGYKKHANKKLSRNVNSLALSYSESEFTVE